MNCQSIRDQLPLLVYGDLSAAESAAIEQHLAGCAGCRADHSAFVQMRQALDATPPPEVVVNLQRIFRLDAERILARRRWPRVMIASALAVAAILLFAVKFEVSIDGRQVVVRWGEPMPPSSSILAETAKATIPATVTSSEALVAMQDNLRALQEVTHALAVDADSRDRSRHADLARVGARVDALFRYVAQRLHDAERDVDALYAARFKSLEEKGAKP